MHGIFPGRIKEKFMTRVKLYPKNSTAGSGSFKTGSPVVYGAELESVGNKQIKIRPFIIAIPSSDDILYKDEVEFINKAVIASNKSISYRWETTTKDQMLAIYPGMTSAYKVDQVKIDNIIENIIFNCIIHSANLHI